MLLSLGGFNVAVGNWNGTDKMLRRVLQEN